MEKLFLSMENLSGVGKKRLELYKKLGIETPYDLLGYFPRSYRDYREPVLVAQVKSGEHAVVRVTVTAKKRPGSTRSGRQIFSLSAEDETGEPLQILFFNNFYTYQSMETGRTYTLYGKVDSGSIINPAIHRESDAPIEAVYPQIAGLTSAMLRTNVAAALKLLDAAPMETLPPAVLEENGLMPLTDAYHAIHQPAVPEDADRARHRFAFEEMLRLQLGLTLMKKRSRRKGEYPMSPATDMQPFCDSLPFSLTPAQARAVGEITGDMCRDIPMNRLLQGDVGSGKTAVAAAACYFCVQNGLQCALMAPTEILADQHYDTLRGFLEPLGIRVALLTGSLSAKEKNAVHSNIASGTAQVIVGTHAIIQKSVTYQNLALVITDEQHRFGVTQRTALAEKGGVPHKLVMSATPIPRTLALMVYGDLEVSVLDSSPKGRLPIKTYAVTGKLRARAMHFVTEELQKGRQAYIVCPAIEESEAGLRSVLAYGEEMQRTLLKGWRVGILHGQLTQEEKEAAMGAFRSHRTDVLICTTVVEVGVDVPNATVMVIEDAERFGLSQLHQLRGRVGRGTHQSHCILITDHVSEESRQRLRLLSSTTDGFAVAQADLKLRGPGDFFGSMQHGLPPLKLASLTDEEMLASVRRAAEDILQKDPDLRLPENHTLYMDILRLFSRNGENGLN